jgi:F420-dependent oxidoreductase-like protein
VPGPAQKGPAQEEERRLPSPCLLVLVGPGASGKSTWAAANFAPDVIVSSDHLRALVGAGEDDIGASTDAFELLDTIVARRCGRGLTTVVDTLGLDDGKRRGWRDAARRAGLPCVAVTFDTPAAECRSRNRRRAKAIPAAALAAQLRSWRRVREVLPEDGFDQVIEASGERAVAVRVVPPAFVDAASAARRQEEAPATLRVSLHLGSFAFAGGAPALRDLLARVATLTEAAGFHAIYVMDHFRQIPQVGRAWEDFLESYTTLAYLASCTDRVRLGALVTGVTYRNPAHLGKIIATLDVLSGGRAVCGLGLAWYRAEHLAYGWPFPDTSERYEVLEDTLQMLPVLWGAGSPAFAGKRVEVPEALCYPRPLQERIPIILGGGGERRTLLLAARYADGANVLGDTERVAYKASVLREHCRQVGRDPDEVQLSNLTSIVIGSDHHHVAELVDRYRPRRAGAAGAAAALNAGTISDHAGRLRQLHEVGVREVMVRVPDPLDETTMGLMAELIGMFR